jgi:hypothetical protein
VAKYRKKPVVIEAMLNDGTTKTADKIRAWSDNKLRDHWDHSKTAFYIDTLEGRMLASPGDYIIRGVQGEYYPCKPDIFAATYELVEE